MTNSVVNPLLRSLCVFCASTDGVRPEYRAAAEELGAKLAKRGTALIYGGARAGLMGAVANATLKHGGRVIGVIPHVLVDKELVNEGCTELRVVATMHERKALMGEQSEAFLVLPGGYGTFEELFEVLAWQTLQIHNKPICILNTSGFYDGMIRFLDHCVHEGVLKQRNREILIVAQTVDEAISKLEAHLAALSATDSI